MYKKNKEKIQKLTILFSLLFSLIFVNFGTILTINWNNSDDLADFNPIDEENEFQFEEDIPTSSQTLNYSGSGKNIDITLHQSLNDPTVKEYNNLDVSNSFNEPFPVFSGYNSSFINITAAEIEAPNKTLTVEDDLGVEVISTLNYHYISFESRGIGYIENVSLHIRETNLPDATSLNIYLFNATDVSGNPRPDSSLATIVSGQSITSDTFYWLDMTGIHELIDSSKTFSNTFFLNLEKTGPPTTNIALNGTFDTAIGDSQDESIVLDSSENLWKVGGIDVDAALIVDLAPLDNTPKPSDVNLTINNIAVTDDAGNGNFGYWLPTETFSSITNQLSFSVNADWWEVSCNITNVQINYTKTDLQATSNFYITDSGLDAQWNVTRISGLNYFDARIDSYNTINFTIPAIWSDSTIKVFNGTEIPSADINKRLLNNGYREVQVLNAGNGTFWYLTANSTNLLSSIDTYINDIAISPSNIANFSSVIEFNATFVEFVKDGSLNLSIYSPTPHYMNNTAILSISSTETEFLVDNWDVSDDIKDYGIFLVQMSWNNDTAAAYMEKYITIFADTQITTTIPRSTFDSGDVFDVEVYFGDTGLVEGIDGATLTYSLNGGIDRTTNIDYRGSGYYNITIDCNDVEFVNYGDNVIDLDISKHYYNNQTDSITILIIGETSATITSPSSGSVFDSSETINLVLYYNNTIRNVGIEGATVEYSLNGGSFSSTGVVDNTGGSYSVGISATHVDFNGYGIKTIVVNFNEDYHYNQSDSIDVTLLGETSLTYDSIPFKPHYNSAETFNISVYYEDTEKSNGISGATVEIDVDGTLYSPMVYDNKDGWYNITIDCSDAIFYPYAEFGIRINVSKSYYYNQTNTRNTIITGNVSSTILSPAMNAVYVEGNNFILTVQYYDIIQSAGIVGATIEYSLNDGTTYKSTSVTDNTDGTYDISINTNDSDFPRYGYVDIIVASSKYLYENATSIYTFHRQINTVITPSNNIDLGNVRRGQNTSYLFSYEDDLTNPITQATMEVIDSQGFGSYLQNHNNGSYTIHLDSTNAAVMDDHVFIFNISSIGNETQVLQLTIDVTIKQTDVADIEYIDEIARHTGDNQSIRFYFNDTTNDLPVLNVVTSNIVLRNYDTSALWNSGGFWLVDSWNNGTYILEVDMGTRTSGWYTLEVNVSKFPDYEVSIFLVSFYFRGNYTDINLISLADLGGTLNPIGTHNYTIFEGSNLAINFNITDSEFFDNLVVGDADTYTVSFFNLVTSASGMLVTSINFQTQSHIGTIFTSNLALVPGRYLINISTSRINYENASFAFNLTIIEKYQVRLVSVYQPIKVDAGNAFVLIIRSEYFNGTDWLPIIGSDISITEINGFAAATINPVVSNGTGDAEFEITVNINAINMNLNVSLQIEYYHQATSIAIADIEINPAFSFADLIPYFILFGALLVATGVSVGVYRGAILPKKREKQRILTEVKTIFDDAINLEHILVLYKGTGTCIYFKSYGSEEIDPELIGGFLSAVSSFGKEMVAQEALNEISYGDKVLLLADGVYSRVALVLGKKGSLILRRNLKRFIEAFENTYKDILPKWRGQLNHFMNAGRIVDDLLNTSIILPHQISYDFTNIKELKISHSKDVLKVAHNCCEEADRKFFFIATLLKEAAESTNKDTAEIFMGIKELRDKRMLIPIEISAIEAQPISQQEINLINQKVSQLANLTNEEKQKMVSDLSRVGPAEREAYLTSFSSHQQIVSAPIKSKVGTTIIEDKKSAKKQLKILEKAASNLKNKKDYPKSIDTYRRAAVIASNWELSNEFIKLEEEIRKTTIEDLQHQKKLAELEAKEATKKEDYSKAAIKFKESSKIASEIFKLGVTGMMKEVKRLTNKANEMDKIK